MRMILIAVLTLILGNTYVTTANALDYDYDFKPGTQCENPNHTQNMTGLAGIRDKLDSIVRGVEEADMLQQAWMEAVESPEVHQHDGYSDYILVYKNYPHAGMIVAFKEGCYVGHVQMPLDLLNKILYLYGIKSKGL